MVPRALVTDPLVTAVTTQKLRRTLFCKCRKDIWGLNPLRWSRGLAQVRKVFPTVAILRIGAGVVQDLNHPPLKGVFYSVSY